MAIQRCTRCRRFYGANGERIPWWAWFRNIEKRGKCPDCTRASEAIRKPEDDGHVIRMAEIVGSIEGAHAALKAGDATPQEAMAQMLEALKKLRDEVRVEDLNPDFEPCSWDEWRAKCAAERERESGLGERGERSVPATASTNATLPAPVQTGPRPMPPGR